MYRVHLLSLPHTQTTKAYSLDGFSQVTIRFCRILKALGYTVYLYASEENEAPCDELIKVISKEEQESLLGMGPWEYQTANIEEWSPIFQLANSRAAVEIGKRKQSRDFICQIGGWSQHYVSDRHPELPTVEYSIGYEGSFSKYRVFESYAWMHETYGRQGIRDGRFFDAVIPCFYDPDEFPFVEKAEDYLLYCGRLIERKGVAIACAAARESGLPLKIIGHGNKDLISYGTYLGAVNDQQRNEAMSRARAVITPTQYIEPFNQAAVEAQLCGTPVISTDFGGFTETVEHGKTGFRCHYLGEFIDAISKTKDLDRQYVRRRAVQKYSLHNVKWAYQRYFNQLSTLWGDGWNSTRVTDPAPVAAEPPAEIVEAPAIEVAEPVNISKGHRGETYGPRWLEWLKHLRTRHAVGMEIGTFEGESAEWMLDNIFIQPSSRYVCVDTFAGSAEHAKFNVDCSQLEKKTRERLARFGDRAVIEKGYSHHRLIEWARKARETRDGIFDLVYVDGSHDAMNVLQDGVLGFCALKPGGILMFDDYYWDGMPDELDRPRIAIDSFLKCYARHLEVIQPVTWQLAVRKLTRT